MSGPTGSLTRRQPEEGTPELDEHGAELKRTRLRTQTARNVLQTDETELGHETVEEPETFRWNHFVAQLTLHLLYPFSLLFAGRWLGVKPRNQWLTFRRARREPGMTSFHLAALSLQINLGNVMTILLYTIVVLSMTLGEQVELLTSSEVLLACFVHVLRLITVAVKYGFMPLCVYETVTQSDDQDEVIPLMMDELLVMWMVPSDAHIIKEISRAAVERGFQQDEVIQFDTAKFHFGDATDANRLMNMIQSTCKCHTRTQHSDVDTVTLRVADVCYDIYRKCANDTAAGWHTSVMHVVSVIVTSLPFFWRADHYGWANVCGRPEHPIEMILIVACAYTIFTFTTTNVRFMLICLYDFQRRFRSLQLCTELIKPTFSLKASIGSPDLPAPGAAAAAAAPAYAVSSTGAVPVTPLAQRDDAVDSTPGDPERQMLHESVPAKAVGPRRRVLTTIRHPPVLDLVDLGTANATGWFVLYDTLTLLGKRYMFRCQVIATGNILLLLAGGLKLLADIWADNSLQLWVNPDPSVSLLPVTFFAYSFSNVGIVVGCIILGHKSNLQWGFAKVEIRACQRELAMIEDCSSVNFEARRRQAHDTLQLLSAIAKEMKELNIVRPIKIMGVRADMKLLASVGTAVGTIIGVVSQRLANQERSDTGSM